MGAQQASCSIDLWLGIYRAKVVKGEWLRKLRLLVREFFGESAMGLGVEDKNH